MPAMNITSLIRQKSRKEAENGNKGRATSTTTFPNSAPRTIEPAAQVRAEMLRGGGTESESEESLCSSDSRVNNDVRRAQFKDLSLWAKVWSKPQHKEARYTDTEGKCLQNTEGKRTVPKETGRI